MQAYRSMCRDFTLSANSMYAFMVLMLISCNRFLEILMPLVMNKPLSFLYLLGIPPFNHKHFSLCLVALNLLAFFCFLFISHLPILLIILSKNPSECNSSNTQHPLTIFKLDSSDLNYLALYFAFCQLSYFKISHFFICFLCYLANIMML